MKQLFLDTNVIIDHVHKATTLLLDLHQEYKKGNIQFFVNPVVISEYYSIAEMENKELLLLTKEKLFSQFTCVQITEEDGYIASALIRSKLSQSLADALIAASCIDNNLELVTKNKKHFKHISGLQIYNGY